MVKEANMADNQVGEQARYVVAYILHDAAANVEGYITDFSEDSLRGAEEIGLLILAEYSDGSREIVKARDVREPKPKLNGVTLVKPEYVDNYMAAVVDVFAALQTLMLPEAAVLAAEGAATPASDPKEAFRQALERLREMAYGGDAA